MYINNIHDIVVSIAVTINIVTLSLLQAFPLHYPFASIDHSWI